MPAQGSSNSSSPDASIHTGGSDRQGSAGTLQHIRALAMPFTKGQMITEPDGSLLIKDVPMLAEGVWTDSAVGTPLNYISKTLEADAANWLDNSGWNRHAGKVPRASTDKVGEAVNPHFGRFMGDDGKQHSGVLSDVRVWPWTQNQRDMQEMIRHNLISFVSVEHGGPEKYNPQTRQMESAGLIFTGFAFVNKGACKLCRLNEEPQPSTPTEQEPPAAPAPAEETMADTKELEAKIADLTKELEAVKAQKPAEVKVEIPKELSELPGQMKALADQNKALAEQIKELAARPAAPVAAPPADPARELEVPADVPFDRKNRTIVVGDY